MRCFSNAACSALRSAVTSATRGSTVAADALGSPATRPAQTTKNEAPINDRMDGDAGMASHRAVRRRAILGGRRMGCLCRQLHMRSGAHKLAEDALREAVALFLGFELGECL